MTSTASADCPEFNLYLDNSTLDEIPIKNQGFTGMCYAVAASDLMTFELKSQGSPEVISPFWFAMNHKRKRGSVHWTPDSLSYSLLSWSYKEYFSAKHCGRSAAEMNLDFISKDTGLSPFNIIETYELLWDYLRLGSKNPKPVDIEEIVKYITVKFKEKFIVTNLQIQKLLYHYFPIEKYKSLIHFYDEQFFTQCQNEKKLNDKVSITTKLTNDLRAPASETSQENQLLNILKSKQGSPLAIGYCSRIIKYPGHRVPNRSAGLPIIASSKCGAHYSLIVGAREHKNKCEILIRNSYGEKYWANEGYQCFCQNRISGEKYNCQKQDFNIEQERVLGCWFSSRDLAANTFDLSYIKP